MFAMWTWFAVLLVTTLAAVTDARSGKIPNWLTLPALVLAVLAHGYGAGPAGFAHALWGTLICALPPWLVYRASKGSGIGGGDLKLFAALGAWLGASAGLEVQFGAYVALCALAFCVLAYRGLLFRTLWNTARLCCGRLLPVPAHNAAPTEQQRFTEMRLGPAIWLASVAVFAARHPQHWM